MLRIGQLAILFVSFLSAPVWAVNYRFDPDHTFPVFEIDHLGFSTQRGQFDSSHGTLEFDAVQQTGSMEVVIDADSLDTGNAARDAILKGPQWFDAKHYPTITFRGQRFVFDQGQPVAREGELTMHGVTQPLRLDIIRLKCGLNLVTRRRTCGADATGTLKRSRFGMTTGLPFVGDDVRLRIQAEAYLDNQAP